MPKECFAALHTTISNLRAELRRVLGSECGNAALRSFNHRYYLKIDAQDMWWDWAQLQLLAKQRPVTPDLLEKAEQLYRDEFMPLLTTLVPPKHLNHTAQEQFERIAGTISDMAADYETKAAEWMEELRSVLQKTYP